jgi:hypothetical protein
MDSSTYSTASQSNVTYRPRWSRRPRPRSMSQFPTITWHPCIMVVDMFMAVIDVDVPENAGMSFGMQMRFTESEVQMQVCVGHLQSSDGKRCT